MRLPHIFHDWEPIGTQNGTARLRWHREGTGYPVTVVYQRCTKCPARGTYTTDGWWHVGYDGRLEPVHEQEVN